MSPTEAVVRALNAPTTPAQRAKLAAAGFVRVDGLPIYTAKFDPINGREDKLSAIVGRRLQAAELGKFDSNNGKMALITLSGEVWLASVMETTDENEKFSIVTELAPRGNGVWVPASNGEHFRERHLFFRFRNPDWQPSQSEIGAL